MLLSAFSVSSQGILSLLETILEDLNEFLGRLCPERRKYYTSWTFIVNSFWRIKMHHDGANSTAERVLPAVGWTPPVSGVWGQGPSVLHKRVRANKGR